MADTSVVDLNTDFVCSGGKNLNLLNGEVLTSFPGDCGLFCCQLCLFVRQHSASACFSLASSVSQCFCGSACQASHAVIGLEPQKPEGNAIEEHRLGC